MSQPSKSPPAEPKISIRRSHAELLVRTLMQQAVDDKATGVDLQKQVDDVNDILAQLRKER